MRGYSTGMDGARLLRVRESRLRVQPNVSSKEKRHAAFTHRQLLHYRIARVARVQREDEQIKPAKPKIDARQSGKARMKAWKGGVAGGGSE